ncbi:MAG TPA: hypothetical protein P5555_05315 [Candidatus Paceibacterota bacterium]|nr:hypothetical protein [Verrucomicrobiota bacterium]HOX01757.1 hypothetical protein [Verrucomicrobiota bacterium]HRZ44592.1 hypothetical protein [Candidatus Paceibacterota bacterium]HRZ93822.1 hypothetical protein [Candidatus Paceibacterota bacterium]
MLKPSPALSKEAPEASPPPASSAAGAPRPKKPIQFAGLCVDCQNRRTCIYAKVHGGVWHCEDYQ